MRNLSSHFEDLADREGFNASVRHIKSVLGVLDRVSAKENFADVVNDLVEEKSLAKEDLLPVVSMVLGSKFRYRAVSANLFSAAQDLAAIPEETKGWNGVDLVAVYHHPDLGPIVVNPKNPASVARIDRLSRYELLVVWAGRFAKEGEADELEAAAGSVVDLFAGRKVKAKASFLKGECTYKAPKAAKAEAPKGKKPKAPVAPKAGSPKKGKAAVKAPAVEEEAPAPELKPAVQAERAVKPGSRMTPLYSVVVTNELFHNGNVEAWKRIIASFNAKNPDLEVIVYYDGERITNLNALFKWGKVKHGSSIQFAVAGEDIKDVAKLQRYLAQGASPQFEAFLRGPVNAVLPLF
jgi:hypothetical protein